MLEARNVSFNIGTAQILHGISMSLQPGTSTALLGASGSGKSTLLQCLAGLLTPTSGQIFLDDERLDELSDRQRADIRMRQFGFVFQFGELLDELTLAENVALPLRLLGWRRSDARALAGDALDRVGLSHRLRHRPFEVSGGEAQRAAIARAVVHRPSIVLADEPTGALDTANSQAVLDLLTSVVTERAATLLVVTHDPLVAARLDHTITLQDGQRAHRVAAGLA